MEFKDINNITKNLLSAYERDKQRIKKEREAAINGKIPLCIVKIGEIYHSRPFTKNNVWLNNGKKIIVNQPFDNQEIAIDTSGEVAKDLERIRQERIKINMREQIILREGYLINKQNKVPEVKE